MSTRKILFLCFLPLLFNHHCDEDPSTTTEWEFNDQWYTDGWDILQKNEFQRYIVDSTHLTGLVLVHKGKIVHGYGDISDNSYIASCRKSVLGHDLWRICAERPDRS